jgi:fructose-bisphosphate aldolase class I
MSAAHESPAELERTAAAMVAEGKGILAADESTPTITKRLQKLGIESTADARRAYREMLMLAPGASEHISGVILYDETIRQSARDGTPFPRALERAGLLVGIKVDAGAKPLAGFPDEVVTEGLDGLRGRLDEYRGLGARFAKWRAVISIGAGRPTTGCLHANAHALARYAALAQEAGIVPIVEPEVLMDGTHPIERCREVTAATLRAVFAELAIQRVHLPGIVLKPNMVLPGAGSSRQATIDEVAEQTIATLRDVVPPAVPGIAFLSGGQSSQLATAHLNAMNRRGPHPWRLTFSYGRALQDPAMQIWGGSEDGLAAGRQAFMVRARCNGAAARGAYTDEMEAAHPALAA